MTSPTYEITVAHPAARDAASTSHYTYPAGLRLPPRTETDGGDIYAPAGTDVRVQVFTDRPAATRTDDARSAASRSRWPPTTPTELSASLKVTSDDSYRVALADRDGIVKPGDTEYFIRTLEDRPPEVRVLKPATDRSVTRLEEVDIEAQAEDDYGVDRLDLVYSVRGGAEKVVPLDIARAARQRHRPRIRCTSRSSTSSRATSCRTTCARAISRAARGRTKRAATSSSSRSSRTSRSSRWRKARRNMPAAAARAASTISSPRRKRSSSRPGSSIAARAPRRARKSEQDIHAVGRAEAELKTRVEQTSSSFREGTMRDPRRRRSRSAAAAATAAAVPPQPSGRPS